MRRWTTVVLAGLAAALVPVPGKPPMASRFGHETAVVPVAAKPDF